MRLRKHKLSGILNGVDYNLWNPQTDPYLPIHFQAQELERKQELKAELLEEQRLFALPGAPLLAMIVVAISNTKPQTGQPPAREVPVLAFQSRLAPLTAQPASNAAAGRSKRK